MYRFLLTPRWLAAAALTVVAAVVMVFLGNWQLHRYQERSAINARIDAAESVAAVPLATLLTRPTTPGTAGPGPGEELAWTKVTVTGRYDAANEIQARGRTVNGRVGFEIVTPLILDDGTAVLINRGWVPPAAGGAIAAPQTTPPPGGTVTIEGQIHRSESRPAPLERRDGRIDTRRIAVPHIAQEMPYPIYGAYVLLTTQTPEAAPGFTRIPIDHEDAWQNGGYAVQWWMFAVMALLAYAWQARKEAQGDAPRPRRDRLDPSPPPSSPSSSGASASSPSAPSAPGPGAGSGDRVSDADMAAARDKSPGDAPAVPTARRPE